MSRTGEGDWVHLPGPMRAISLNMCLNVCELANNGRCDEPQICRRGTDTNDCRQQVENPETDSEAKLGNECRTRDGYCLLANARPVGSKCDCGSSGQSIPGKVQR
jgi:hypothetical protein